jgi:hypothetical protein
MLSFLTLASLVWSGSIVILKAVYKKNISGPNFVWFALSAAGFVYSIGLIK